MNHEKAPEKKQNFISQTIGKITSHKRITLVVVVLVILGFFLWKNTAGKSAKPAYQTAKVERGTIVAVVSLSGQIASAGNMPVTTQTSGVVKNVFVKNSDVVQAGQNLFELTPDQQSLQRQTAAWANYLSAQNTLNSANQTLYSLQSDMFTKWKTYMDLAQSSSYQNSDLSPKTDARALPQFYSPYDDWLSTEAKYKNQQGVIAQAQAALTSSWNAYQAVSPIVTAPLSGRVDDITLVLGMVISPSLNSQGNSTPQRLATIKTDASPIATFNLTEVDVTKVKAGQHVTMTLDALPGKTFTGKVIGVDTTGVVTSGVTNYPTTIQFDVKSPEILSNMSATAKVIVNTADNVLAVPSSAVQSQNGQSYVRILKNGQIQQVPVEIGITSDTQTAITSGLTEGEDVVTSVVSSQQGTGATRSVFSTGFGGGGGLRPGGFGGR